MSSGRRAGPPPVDTIERETLIVPGPAPGPGDAPALCARLQEMLCRDGPGDVRCDVSAVTEPGLGAVDVLARLVLTARRHGARLRLTGTGARLRLLIGLAGLGGLVDGIGDAIGDGLGGEAVGEPEHREPPVRVEERIQSDDLPA